MPSRWTVALLAVVMAAPCAGAGADEAAGASSSPSKPAGRLDLGRYGRVTPPASAVQSLPRFESAIEVIGVAPRDPNTAMAAHWKQWDLSTGSIYGKGINIQNQGCPTCVNVLPLIGKLVDKIKKK